MLELTPSPHYTPNAVVLSIYVKTTARARQCSSPYAYDAGHVVNSDRRIRSTPTCLLRAAIAHYLVSDQV